ncbi:MAG TPA: hypothetical protein VMB77_12380 [Syntrophales bacterium]|nr:hypothetical protein [Syntrophales bacterium]
MEKMILRRLQGDAGVARDSFPADKSNFLFIALLQQGLQLEIFSSAGYSSAAPSGKFIRPAQ